ncbi:MAG: fibrobacter succinogenes major paralogous domain-containing protein [Bacteroidales bacterium]|nr:fibrobacter succinogenes major paralogous domain-containing protein [Bacteroidales bacterium]
MKKIILLVGLLLPVLMWAQQVTDCGTVTDIDGNRYQTVIIGKQCWMRENLRVTRYADGSMLMPGNENAMTGHCYVFPNGNESLVQKYGLLYTWATAMRDHETSEEVPSGVQGICPDGWHLPSNFEWMNLEDVVGYDDALRCGTDVNNVAKAMASASDWDTNVADDLQPCCILENVNTNDKAGMNVKPAGLCFMGFYGYGTETGFWTASDGSPESAPIHRFYGANATVEINCTPKEAGASVRCVKNE